MVRFENVYKRYNGRYAARDLFFSVPRDHCLVLLGPSGSGKSTLLRLVAGLEKPDRGQIWIDRQLASTPGWMMKPFERSIGMVFQDLALWPHMSVEEHLTFVISTTEPSKAKRREMIRSMLDRVGLAVDLSAFPHQLSGGEKQRLALARALIGEPSILLMDEPLSSLDTLLKQTILGEIQSIIRSSGVTTIYVTHDLHEGLFVADLLAVMDSGRMRSMESVDSDRLKRMKDKKMSSDVTSPTQASGGIGRGDR